MDEETTGMDFSDSETAEFSDGVTESENSEKMISGGYVPSELDYNTPVYYGNEYAKAVGTPAKYIPDLSQYPSVRKQNPYGTCWAFSTMGLAEFDLINNGKFDANIDLSELQLAHFLFNFVQDPLGGTINDTSKFYNDNYNSLFNTKGGYLDHGASYEMAIRRLGQWIGAVKETDVPYTSAASVLENGLDDSYAYSKDVAHLENTYMISLKNNADGVKEKIITNGAVGISYINYANGMTYGNGYNAYYDTENTISCDGDGGHSVMIVGWDDEYSRDNFLRGEQPSTNGAWLIRNSWGDYWDYFWMSYETVSLSDTAWAMDFSTDDGFDNNYQLDGGWRSDLNQNQNTVANIFTVNQKAGVTSETLKAVSLSFTQVANVNYTIDIYTNLMSSQPNYGTHQEAATTSGTTTYAGVYTVPLQSEVELEPGTRFAVVVTMDKPAMDHEEAVSFASGDVKTWDNTVSIADYKSYYKNGNSFSVNWYNYRIKAFTTNNSYKISYELNGGTNNDDNPKAYGKNNAAIILKAPTRGDGYIFDGWYLDENFTHNITEIPANASGDYKLYAKWSSATGESCYGYSLSLDGTIAINMYMDLPSDLASDKNAYMEFTLPNATKSQVKVKDAGMKDSHHVFSCRIVSKEMVDDVTARMCVGNTYGRAYKVSVQKYAEYILTHENAYSEIERDLVKSMLNYGAAAQKLFDYKTDNLVNRILSSEDQTVKEVDFKPYKYEYTKDSSEDGLNWYGGSLVLKSDTCVRDYFVLDDSSNIDSYCFYVAVGTGQKVEVKPVKTSIDEKDYYYVEIANIKAQNLDKDITVTVENVNFGTEVISVKYNAFSYAYTLTDSTKYKTTIDVTNAMYEYCEMAKAYLDSKK